jgi:hypothetical protein
MMLSVTISATTNPSSIVHKAASTKECHPVVLGFLLHHMRGSTLCLQSCCNQLLAAFGDPCSEHASKLMLATVHTQLQPAQVPLLTQQNQLKAVESKVSNEILFVSRGDQEVIGDFLVEVLG